MKNSTPIICPEIEVALHDGKITVRDLPWQDATKFVSMLAGHMQGTAATIFKQSAEGQLTVDVIGLIPQIVKITQSASEVSEFLLTKSTGKEAAWINERRTIEVMALLDAALQVNLSDQLIEMGKGAGGRLGRAFAAMMSATPKLATS